MAVTTNQGVSVATTAVKLADAAGVDRASGSRVTLCNVGATELKIGPSTVTSANGFRVAASGGVFSDTLDPGEELWGVVASGSTTVDVYQGGK